MPGRKIESASEARAYLEAAAASGLARVDWARREGIDARSLNAWRMNLARRSKRRPASATVRLVELVPQSQAPSDVAPYVIRCGDLAVEVDERFEEATLRRLLRALRAC